jgi:hypothetical protein
MPSVQYFCSNIYFLKQILLILVSLLTIVIAFGQTDTLIQTSSTTGKKKQLAESTQTLIVAPVLKDSQSQNSRKPLTILADSLKRDSIRMDSIRLLDIKLPIVLLPDTITYEKYYVSAWLPFQKTPVYEIIAERKPMGKEVLFYILTGLVALLAGIRLIFPKYFKNLFLLFMQTSMRQKQTRENLLQNNLASIFLNILFMVSAGIYITLLVLYKHWVDLSFNHLLLYGVVFLFVVYLVKYIFLAFSGWVFNVPEATSAYSFVVFLVNKVLGIILIPFVWIITFSPLPIKQVAITISAGIILVLFLYRYLISFGVIRTNLKVSVLHFFLYLCAVELLPLFLIYKLLVNFVTGSI